MSSSSPAKKESADEPPTFSPYEDRDCARFVKCTQRYARVYGCSSLMPENDGFKFHSLPAHIHHEDSLRILLLCGNISRFAGDIFETMIGQYLQKNMWDYIIYTPGPLDYGSGGTVELGDAHCSFLQSAFDDIYDGRFIILLPGVFHTVVFEGPRLRIVGAPCWPVDHDLYKTTRLYWTPSGDLSQDGMSEAVGGGHFLTDEVAQERLTGDVATIYNALLKADECAGYEKRIVVSFGCPDEQLATKDYSNSDRRGTVSLGGSNSYKYLNGHVDFWFYGAISDKPRQLMGKVKACNNLYDEARDSFPFGESVIHIEAPE